MACTIGMSLMDSLLFSLVHGRSSRHQYPRFLVPLGVQNPDVDGRVFQGYTPIKILGHHGQGLGWFDDQLHALQVTVQHG